MRVFTLEGDLHPVSQKSDDSVVSGKRESGRGKGETRNTRQVIKISPLLMIVKMK